MIGRRTLLQSLAALPLLGPAGLAAAAAQTPERIAVAPIWLRNARLWMPVTIGAVGPIDFIVDTGSAMNMIDLRFAHQLDLRREGSVRIGGIGGWEWFEVYKAADVRFGEVQVGAVRFAALRPGAGLEAAGLLSNGIFTVADTDLDLDAGEWRLHLDGRGDRSGFEPLPSRIVSDGPGNGAATLLVDVELDGQRYRLALDTGLPDDIHLMPNATRRTGLWNDTTPFVPDRPSGIGGDGGAARLVRMNRAQLGGLAFERPLVTLSRPGPTGEIDGADGLIGLGLIERLNLSTEVRARRVWAKRNARPPRAERYAMSGLWLAERGDGVTVEVVGTGSPASAAGLRAGDRLGGGSLVEWIRRLAGRPGETIEIPFTRGGESRTVTLTLREYL